MTEKRAKRVMVFDNVKSDTIERAIFILKSDKQGAISAKKENSAAYEAQRIIDDYVRRVEKIKIKNPRTAKKRTASRKTALLFALLAFFGTCAVFAAVFALLSGQC